MLQKQYLQEIMISQKETIVRKDKSLSREQLLLLPDVKNFATIVSGIRRCGKSTLLFQMLREKYPQAVYINFDDPRLVDFELSDTGKLDELIAESRSNVLMFDEIQIIKGWERYVRQKSEENFRVFVTGSNTSLLSGESGTSLTGRHLSSELFPFSYNEFCRFFSLEKNKESVLKYLNKGGFPEYLKNDVPEILMMLLDDILFRDIAIRYNLRDIKTLQRLTLFLLSNVGNYVSGNKLKNTFNILSTTTILEYFSHLEQCYLLNFVPLFDYSLKKQNINPKKIYAIDTGLVEIVTPSFKSDAGHKFENLIFLSLRRQYKEIYYYKNKGECDFLIMEKGIIHRAIQACYHLNPDNLQRELSGLYEAMQTFDLKNGFIITLDQKDHFEKDGMSVEVLPSFLFL
ncbi:MAG: ATP-binding protein [Candidatus Azobacteroides sp.]|nr:ATP-binding protein [Candidatus Azobacteroides sp.]